MSELDNINKEMHELAAKRHNILVQEARDTFSAEGFTLEDSNEIMEFWESKVDDGVNTVERTVEIYLDYEYEEGHVHSFPSHRFYNNESRKIPNKERNQRLIELYNSGKPMELGWVPLKPM